MNRKIFLKSFFTIGLSFIIPVKAHIPVLLNSSALFVNKFREKILEIIKQLKKEGSDIVRKVMNGKTYVFDPSVHYPFDGGISDNKTGCRIFFHAHRQNEYGHFHTFATDDKGDLIHLVLISMNEEGEPVAISTVNRWVTDDKYVKAETLKRLLAEFKMDEGLFTEKRVVEFVYSIINAYKDIIYQLFDERDEWIKRYVRQHYNEPFEDRNYEILSEIKIDVYA